MKPTAFPLRMACLAALCGLFMSTLPYFAWYKVAHSSVWIADVDEIQYTIIASHAYYWHPLYLSDPTFVNGGKPAYSWLQLVPGELVCKAINLRPVRFGLVVRIFGGLAVGFGWFALIWQYVRRPWVAMVGAILLLTDGGWSFMRPFIYQWHTLANVLLSQAEDLFAQSPRMHLEWRIISPAVVLPFLFLYLWTLRRSVEEFSRTRVIWSGLAFGLLIHAYFYFWTAAGLALLMGILVDRARWQVYFHTGWIGALVGAPEFARMLFARHGQGSEWMQRVGLFVPIGRLSEQGPFLFSAALVVIMFVIVRRYFRSLLYLWCLCAAAFILIHEQLFTGLLMWNLHWATYVFGPCMMLLLVLVTIDVIGRMGSLGHIAGKILVAAVVLNTVVGVYLRGLEAIRTKDSQRYSLGYADYEKQRTAPDSHPLVAGANVAGIEDFVQFAMIADHTTPLAAEWPVLFSPTVSNSDLDRRIALNDYLSGTSREQFEAKETWKVDHLQWGIEFNSAKRAARLADRLSSFDQIALSPSAAIERYHVRYVALPAGSPKPATLRSDWDLLQAGPTWEVWERNTSQNF